MSQFALIACRVSFETKVRVRQLAEREGITESTLLRQLLEVVLRTAGVGEPPPIAPHEKVNRDARVNVRLEREDWRLLKERAKARGLASATYLSYLTRSHLRGAAPLPNAEYTLLKQSVEQLAAVGRNLSQIARGAEPGQRIGWARTDGARCGAQGDRGPEAALQGAARSQYPILEGRACRSRSLGWARRPGSISAATAG